MMDQIRHHSCVVFLRRFNPHSGLSGYVFFEFGNNGAASTRTRGFHPLDCTHAWRT